MVHTKEIMEESENAEILFKNLRIFFLFFVFSFYSINSTHTHSSNNNNNNNNHSITSKKIKQPTICEVAWHTDMFSPLIATDCITVVVSKLIIFVAQGIKKTETKNAALEKYWIWQEFQGKSKTPMIGGIHPCML